MNNKGSFFLIVAPAVVILVMVGAALFMMMGGSGSAGSGGSPTTARSGPKFSVALARTSTGLTATLSVTNKGSEDLHDLQIIRADIAAMVGGKPMPIVVGKLANGATTSITLPYTGPVPAANSPVQLNYQYDYKSGFFTKGAGSNAITTILP